MQTLEAPRVEDQEKSAEDEIVHLYCVLCAQTWPEEKLAICGWDLRGHREMPEANEDCVVCVDILDATKQCRRGHWLMD